MSTVLEKARGAAAFSRQEVDLPDFSENSAARFVRRPSSREWDERLAQLKAFRSLDDDWDGDGSPAPGPDMADGAIFLANSLQRQGKEAPDRVVVGVNGTIYFEWHGPEGYYEIEVYSPNEAEGRWVQDGSDRVIVSMLGRGK
jgi:hypothetical protein